MTVVVLVGVVMARVWLPGWLVMAGAGVIVVALGVHGQRRDAPIVSRAVDLPAE